MRRSLDGDGCRRGERMTVSMVLPAIPGSLNVGAPFTWQ